ncbi:MAG: hypothetical protein ACI85F_002110 [Bacteroidia bacterium]|jgi:hypothetical protein
MIYYALVVVAGLFFSIGIILLKKPFFSFALATTKLLNAILDTESDEDTKQKNLIQNLGPLLKNMAVFLLLLLAIVGIASLPLTKYLWLDYSDEPDTSSWYFYLSLGIGSVIPFLVPLKKDESDYSDWSKLLHRMVLDNHHIGKTLFFLERKLFKKKLHAKTKPFVVVTGLARAGTTALTNLLFQAGDFHSLSYDNMPFLLAPNTWRKFYRVKDESLKERAHGDQVQFGFKTIEALEEYFFKTFLNNSFIGSSQLKKHEVNEKTYQAYIEYQQLVSTDGGNSTYLAKNNNLILRYDSLRSFDQEFKTVLIFRDPIDHAASLLAQHARFLELHSEDPFNLEYMNWLGHHEFGLNHKPFQLDGSINEFDQSTIQYWVNSWLNYHRHVLSMETHENLVLIDYSDLLEKPAQLLSTLQTKLNMDLNSDQVEVFTPRKKETIQVEEILKDEAYQIHQKLMERAISI